MNYRKPVKLKILHGTDQPCRRKTEAKVNDDLPLRVPPPEYLNPSGRKKWNELVRLLRKKGILEKTDLGSLEACCAAYDEMVECQLAIKKYGGIVEYTDGKTSQQVPLLSARNRAMEVYKKFMSEFGLSPASRAKLGLGGEEPKESEFEKLLKKVN